MEAQAIFGLVPLARTPSYSESCSEQTQRLVGQVSQRGLIGELGDRGGEAWRFENAYSAGGAHHGRIVWRRSMTRGASALSTPFVLLRRRRLAPEPVAKTLLEITSSKPRLRYLIGRQAKSVARLRQLLPAGVFEPGVRRSFLLDRSQ
jgi:hypothetical protein